MPCSACEIRESLSAVRQLPDSGCGSYPSLISTGVVVGGGGGGSFLTFEDSGRMVDHSFPANAFFLLLLFFF